MRVLLDECVDRRLAREIPGHEYSFAVMILHATSNRLAELRPLIPRLLEALAEASPGKVAWVEGGTKLRHK